MNGKSLLMLAGWMICMLVPAGAGEWRCFNDDFKKFIPVTRAVTHHDLQDKLSPEVDQDGKLAWIARPANVTCTIKLIGVHNNRKLYEVSWMKPDPTDLPKPAHQRPYNEVMLAMEDKQGIRPFFWFTSGDMLIASHTRFQSSKVHPFMLVLSMEWDGHGLNHSDFSFLFDNDGPWLLETSEGSHRSGIENRKYNRQGKVIHKESLSREDLIRNTSADGEK